MYNFVCNSSCRLYRIWCNMKQRCKNPSSKDATIYANVTLCSEWENSKSFAAWALSNGYTDELQIDRIDNSKGYSPSNCRWVTPMQQAQNRCTTKIVLCRTLRDWAMTFEKSEDAQMNYIHRTYNRLLRGWHPYLAVFAPEIPRKEIMRNAYMSEKKRKNRYERSLKVFGKTLMEWADILCKTDKEKRAYCCRTRYRLKTGWDNYLAVFGPAPHKRVGSKIANTSL